MLWTGAAGLRKKPRRTCNSGSPTGLRRAGSARTPRQSLITWARLSIRFFEKDRKYFLMTTLPSRAQSAYALLLRCATSLQSLFLLFVRLYWGWQFAVDGWGKAIAKQ